MVERVTKVGVGAAAIIAGVSVMPPDVAAQTPQLTSKPTLVRETGGFAINYATANPTNATIRTYIEKAQKYLEYKSELVKIATNSKEIYLTSGNISKHTELFAKANFTFADQLDFFNQAIFNVPDGGFDGIERFYQALKPYLHPQIILWEKSLAMAIHIRQIAETNLKKNTNPNLQSQLQREYENSLLFSWYKKLEPNTRSEEDERLQNLKKVFDIIIKLEEFKIDTFRQAKWAQIISNNLQSLGMTQNINIEIVLQEYARVKEYRKQYGELRPFNDNKIVVIRASQKITINGKQEEIFFNSETEERARINGNEVQVRTLSTEAKTQTEVDRIYSDIINDKNTKIFYHIGHGEGIRSVNGKNGEQGVNDPFMDLGKSNVEKPINLHIKFQNTAEALVKRLANLDEESQKPRDMVWIVSDMCNATDAVSTMQKVFDKENSRRLEIGQKPLPPIGFVAASGEREFTIFQKKYDYQTTLSQDIFSGKTLNELIDTTPEGSAYTFHIFNLPEPQNTTPKKIQLGEVGDLGVEKLESVRVT